MSLFGAMGRHDAAAQEITVLFDFAGAYVPGGRRVLNDAFHGGDALRMRQLVAGEEDQHLCFGNGRLRQRLHACLQRVLLHVDCLLP